MASSFNPLRNPELNRILRINLPARRLLFVGGFALAIVMVIAGLEWNSYASYKYSNPYENVTKFGRETYWMLTVVMFGLVFVLAPAMTALSFVHEKLRGTAIFQQMVLISPFEMAVGKFFGSGAASYLAALVILPFALFAAVLGNQNADSVLKLYMFLFVGGLSFQALGLFISAAVAGPADKAIRGGLLIGPAVGVLGAVTALYWSRYFYERSYSTYRFYRWQFYGLEVPGYLVILGLLIFVGVWAFAGAVGRIKASQLVSVPVWPVWLFFATAEALVVGLLWGWQLNPGKEYGTAPISNLVFYIFINWAALLILAGCVSLSRNRLREWWSAGHDPLGLFQRQEIRNNFKTFLITLLIAEAGIVALWISYHMDAQDFPQNLTPSQLVPIVLGFGLTILGMLAFVQYCAMQRFRARGWAGVVMVVVFYLVTGIAGTLFEDENNTPALFNPAIYSYAITAGDPFMDRVAVLPNSYDKYEQPYKYEQPPYNTAHNRRARSVTSGIVAHGLLAEGLLALGCFGLALMKWRKIQDEMLPEKAG